MLTRYKQALVAGLPRGASLPPETWQGRHRAIVALVVAGSGVVALFSAGKGPDHLHGVAESALPVAMALAAWRLPFGRRRFRASLCSAALMVVAGLVVHIFGTIEAHFLYFIMVPVVALYEDWAPFATAASLVFFHHGISAISDPTSVFNHQAALENPLLWSLIHSALFLAMCVTSIVHWNIHERARSGERKLRDKLAQQALHDPLTGLANRRQLTEQLAEATRTAPGRPGTLAVMVLDIDGFKPINDEYGHAAGDAVLVEIAARLRKCVRTGDTVARLGGDEFALVLPGLDERQTFRIAERIIAAVAEPVMLEGTRTNVSASLGVAAAADVRPGRDLLWCADVAMYAAKRAGRNRYIMFRPELQEPLAGHVPVQADDARAWAHYTRQLREQIATAKEDGRLPAQTRAPESARRTMDSLVAAIEQLSAGPGVVGLQLPGLRSVEEFIFHHSMVLHWADALTAKGIISVERPAAADNFW